MLVALYAITAVLAGLVTTKASAALMFPIAATAAEAQGIGLLPISYMTMIAAATAFSTPIGFQTNLMVYGPGGYKYTDFLRLGLPLQVLGGRQHGHHHRHRSGSELHVPRFPNVSQHAHSVSHRVYSDLEQRALHEERAHLPAARRRHVPGPGAWQPERSGS